MRAAADLRPYQNRAITHLYENDEALCVIRPGGGKTVVALTAIAELLADKVIRHALVIAPKRVARVVWPDEIAQWLHLKGLRYQVLAGTPKQRLHMLLEAPNYDLTIAGLDIAQWLVEEMKTTPPDHPLFDLLVIDEASRLRNPSGERAKALSKVAHHWKMVWGLSGTLRPSSALDLFMPSRVVTRGKLWGKSYYKWRQQYFYPADFQGYEWWPLPCTEDVLNTQIAPLIATVAEDELKQPEATIVYDRVTLPTDARRAYDSMEKRLFTRIEAHPRTVVAVTSAVASGKLAQIANGFVYDEVITHLIHDEKRLWLEDIVENATGPTLLVYHYREDLELLRKVVDDDLPYLGEGVSDRQAAAHIAEWNAGKLPFMALHPASGGHGLNLQHGGADMAWLSPTWSPEYWEQTIARINRSGQKRQVIVRVCVATNTVDDLKLMRVHLKMTAQDAFEAYLRRWQTRNKTA